jgi:hypothetical protein
VLDGKWVKIVKFEGGRRKAYFCPPEEVASVATAGTA